MTEEDKALQAEIAAEIHEIIPQVDEDTFKELDLTPQEILFIYQYVESNDAVASYQRSFGVEYKKALSQGRKLINQKRIMDGCRILREKIWERSLEVLPLVLLQELEAIRSFSVADYYDADGRIKMLDAIPEAKQLLIKDVEYIVNTKTGEVIVKYVLPDKEKVYSKYLELLKLKGETKRGDEDAGVKDTETRALVASIFAKKGES